jgi:hypothetical protein
MRAKQRAIFADMKKKLCELQKAQADTSRLTRQMYAEAVRSRGPANLLEMIAVLQEADAEAAQVARVHLYFLNERR